MALLQDIAELVAFVFVGIFVMVLILEFGELVVNLIFDNLLATIGVAAIAMFLYLSTQEN